MCKNFLGNHINQLNFWKDLSPDIYFVENLYFNLLVEIKYEVLKNKSNGFKRY